MIIKMIIYLKKKKFGKLKIYFIKINIKTSEKYSNYILYFFEITQFFDFEMT